MCNGGAAGALFAAETQKAGTIRSFKPADLAGVIMGRCTYAELWAEYSCDWLESTF